MDPEQADREISIMSQSAVLVRLVCAYAAALLLFFFREAWIARKRLAAVAAELSDALSIETHDYNPTSGEMSRADPQADVTYVDGDAQVEVGQQGLAEAEPPPFGGEGQVAEGGAAAEERLQAVCAMGFGRAAAESALVAANGDVEGAIDLLLNAA